MNLPLAVPRQFVLFVGSFYRFIVALTPREPVLRLSECLTIWHSPIGRLWQINCFTEVSPGDIHDQVFIIVFSVSVSLFVTSRTIHSSSMAVTFEVLSCDIDDESPIGFGNSISYF